MFYICTATLRNTKSYKMKHFNKNTAAYNSRYPNIELEVAGAQTAFGANRSASPGLGFAPFRLLSDWLYYLLVGLFSMVNNVFEFIVTLLKQTKLLPYFRFGMLIAFLYLGFYQGVDKTTILHSSHVVASSHGNSPNNTSIVTAPVEKPKKEKDPFALAYVERFSKVAKVEMHKFGVPASIKLAQGLLESNNGKSRLAAENYNHFGLKCFSKTCAKGHCSNHSDDSHKDFFRKYKSAWESWRDHSQFLSGPRYAHLKSHGNDYKQWAKGLKKAGYATDKKYDKKLIALIELYDLDRFDK